MADTHAATSGQDPTAQPNTAGEAGTGYRPQAGDARTDERAGPDDGRRTPSGEQTDAQGNAQDDLTPAQLRAMLKQARDEAAANRKAKQELDELRKAEADAKLSETERLQQALAEAQRERELISLQAQERVIRADVRSAAHDLGVKPELALKLIDLAAVSFDEAGDPTNIKELIEQAIADYGLAPAAPAQQPAQPPTGQPGVVARMAPPQVPATGATNPSRGATQQQPLVRSVHDIKWRRG